MLSADNKQNESWSEGGECVTAGRWHVWCYCQIDTQCIQARWMRDKVWAGMTDSFEAVK